MILTSASSSPARSSAGARLAQAQRSLTLLGRAHPIAEALAEFTTGAWAEEGFVRAAEQAGVPETYCSFHKVLIGSAMVGSLAKRVKAEPPYLMTGGVAQNVGVVRALEDVLGAPVATHEDSQPCGAIGAALLGLESLG